MENQRHVLRLILLRILSKNFPFQCFAVKKSFVSIEDPKGQKTEKINRQKEKNHHTCNNLCISPIQFANLKAFQLRIRTTRNIHAKIIADSVDVLQRMFGEDCIEKLWQTQSLFASHEEVRDGLLFKNGFTSFTGCLIRLGKQWCRLDRERRRIMGSMCSGRPSEVLL